MSRKQREIRRLKDSIPYFIVEGCTEENYLKVLKRLFRKKIKIENVNGGNARSVIQKALKIIKNNIEYSKFLVWFDNDRFFSQDKDILNQLNQKNCKIIQSYPCIESWLLSHFKEIYNTQLVNTCKYFEDELRNYIKSYKKNNCNQLNNSISLSNIKEAKNNYPKYKNNIEYIFKEINND